MLPSNEREVRVDMHWYYILTIEGAELLMLSSLIVSLIIIATALRWGITGGIIFVVILRLLATTSTLCVLFPKMAKYPECCCSSWLSYPYWRLFLPWDSEVALLSLVDTLLTIAVMLFSFTGLWFIEVKFVQTDTILWVDCASLVYLLTSWSYVCQAHHLSHPPYPCVFCIMGYLIRNLGLLRCIWLNARRRLLPWIVLIEICTIQETCVFYLIAVTWVGLVCIIYMGFTSKKTRGSSRVL